MVGMHNGGKYLTVNVSFLALGFASVLLTAVPPTRSYPTPGLLMDIPSVKTAGQQLYIHFRHI